MGYTSEEVQASIDKFLLGTVTTPRTSLGARDVLSARDDIYALLTTTLLLRPDSYFYVIWLAKNRLEALRRLQVEDLNFILSSSSLASLTRRGKPVSSTTELTNAQAALLNLNTGLAQGQSSQTRDLGPEVARFRNNIERFISAELRPNVVEAGEPTETAGEVRDRIAALWADVKVRHAEMLTLAEAIRDAVPNLSSIRLPEKAVREVITRLQTRLDELTISLAADKTLSTHRESMLELLTMRTLLTRVSSFRTPLLILAPLSGDSKQVTGVGGITAASILGTISGPFNVPPASTLDFESGSPIVASSVPISYSNAEVSSREVLAFPFNFPVSAELRLRVNGALYPGDASFGGAAYANLAAFVAALQNYITVNVVPATVFVSGLRAVLRSTSASDSSSIEVLASAVAQQNFVSTSGFDRYGLCRPVTSASIIANAAPYIGVRLSDVVTEYFTGRAVTVGAGVLDLSKVSGTIVITGGTTFSAPVNFENIGVVAGDWLRVGAEVRQITYVLGGEFAVDTALPNLGFVSYRVGADFRGAPIGARVLVNSVAAPLNIGPYRIVVGDIARVTVDRNFFTTADAVSVLCFTSFLRASAPGATPADGITAWPASVGSTAVGYVPSAVQTKADFTELDAIGSVDFLARGVGAGDIITLLTSPPASTTVAAVSINSLDVAPTPYFLGSVGYRLESSRYIAWVSLTADIEAFLSTINFENADFAITRILSGAAPGSAGGTGLLGSGGPVGLFYSTLLALEDIEGYVVPFERSIDSILRMLNEQGMDRAADLFTTLQIIEFFNMHPDGVSYSTHLIRTTHSVTMEVAPESRFARSIITSPEVRLRSRRLQSG